MKKEVAKETGIEMFLQAIQTGVVSLGSQFLEDSGAEVATQVLGEVALETGTSLVPIVGSAISSYRMNKKINNLNEFIKLVAKRLDSFIEKVEKADQMDKGIYSELLDFAYESVESYSQKEKIEYLVNGLESIFQNEELSFDIAYVYINTLNRLTLLDLSVIKLYNNRWADYDNPGKEYEFKTFEDILTTFKITYEQYKSIQSNLYLIGLLETKTDQTLEKDLESIEKNVDVLDKNIKLIHSDLTDLLNPRKKVNRLKTLKKVNVKVNAKDQFVLSKFGRDFYRFFLIN